MGLIYLAYNKITNKSYIGQTTKTLEYRKNQHLTRTIKTTTKFGRALQLYSYDKWDWIVIKDNIPKDKLDYEEMFYIKALSTFSKGYNSTGGGQFGYKILANNKDNIYCFYHNNYGNIEATIPELSSSFKIREDLIFNLVLGKRDCVNGWILEENISVYNKIKKEQKQKDFITKFKSLELVVKHKEKGIIHTNVYDFLTYTNLHLGKILKLQKGKIKKLGEYKLVL